MRAFRRWHEALRRAVVAGVVLAAAWSAGEEPGAYARGGVQACLDCHDAASDHPADQVLSTVHGLAADPRSPLAGGGPGCESCHGPSAAHVTRSDDGSRPPPDRVFHRGIAAHQRSEVCLACHQDSGRVHWHTSSHQFEDVACSDCHRIHQHRDPVLDIETQAQVCFGCHLRQRAEFNRPSRHPVQGARLASRVSLMACTDCHDPHGGSGPSELVRGTLNETCYDCHAEMRGPFLWEHAPVREDCSVCHAPHGSQHEKLLVSRSPWLCQQCHLAQFHPSTQASGLDVPPRGRSDLVLARGCVNCHTNVHGSNHPSGVRLTR